MKDNVFVAGWVYFVLMFILEAVLPEWVGVENGIIENVQLLWLVAGFVYCYKIKNEKDIVGTSNHVSLCYAGMIYFFLLFMREISWGRTLLHHPDGSNYEYSDMGLFGQMVHPLVGLLIVAMLIFLWRGKIWSFLKNITFPYKDFVLLLLFIFMSWVGEKSNFTGFHGMVAEELAEFGAYMMMYILLKKMLRKTEDK